MMDFIGNLVSYYFTYCLIVFIVVGVWWLRRIEMEDCYIAGFRVGYNEGWNDGYVDARMLGEGEVAGPLELE